MGVTNIVLTCERDNEQLRKDIKYYKNYNSRLRNNLKQKDNAIDECIEWINKVDGVLGERHKIVLLEKLKQAKGVNNDD